MIHRGDVQAKQGRWFGARTDRARLAANRHGQHLRQCLEEIAAESVCLVDDDPLRDAALDANERLAQALLLDSLRA
jgi:hypothetical protein